MWHLECLLFLAEATLSFLSRKKIDFYIYYDDLTKTKLELLAESLWLISFCKTLLILPQKNNIDDLEGKKDLENETNGGHEWEIWVYKYFTRNRFDTNY